MDHCLRSRHYVNVLVAGKHPAPVPDNGCGRQGLHRGHRYLAVSQQRQGQRARRGRGLLWRCAHARDTRRHFHYARIVNVVDLMKLQPQTEHPHGLSDLDFDELFTRDKPVIFAFHGLSVADPPADLSAHQPSESSRPRLQGRRHDHDALRHDGDE